MTRKLFLLLFFVVLTPLIIAAGIFQSRVGLPLMREQDTLLGKTLVAVPFVLLMPVAFYVSVLVAGFLTRLILPCEDAGSRRTAAVSLFLHWFAGVLAVCMLLAAVGFDHSPLFYAILRVVVFVTCWVAAGRAFRLKLRVPFWSSLATLVLFNPILPFYFTRETWRVIDLVAAVMVLYVFSQTHRSPKTRPASA